jgi:FlaA1/EpsC-like NDP-sugar epimerase
VKEFRKFLLNNRITPKWVIFLLDLLLCVISFTYAIYQLQDLKIISSDQVTIEAGLISVVFLCSVFFVLFRTYEGIIRFSEVHEILRATAAVFCSFFSIIVLNIILSFSKGGEFIPDSVLFVYFFCSAFMISGYRIIVKMLYNADTVEAETVPVIIYGAGKKGSLLQKTIGKISDTPYKVVAFIEDDETLVGKTVNSVRIYSYKQLSMLLKPFRIKVLFFSTSDTDVSIKNDIVDKCLAHHVKVMSVPSLDGWMQNHLKTNILKEVKIEELLGRPAIKLYNPEVISFLCNKNILITGAAGSIGSELARQIAEMNPASLILCDQVETGLHDLEYELQKNTLGEKLKFYLGDVKDMGAMENLFQAFKPQIVFHAAAYKHVPIMEKHPSEAVRNNVLGTKVLADLSKKYLVDRFLFISTDKAINPTNIMGASKRIAEMYCHTMQANSFDRDVQDDHIIYRMSNPEHKTKFITTRFGNVLASNGSVIPRFREQIENGGPVTVTHPEIIRYFMTIQEACSLVLEAVTMGKGGEVLLFDMGEPLYAGRSCHRGFCRIV